jgi:hypothetical protein
MVICIVALVVFSILGIFSSKYRKIAKDAFRCVFLMITFRPCDVQLEQKIKSKATAKLMRISPKMASAFYKNFKIISWIFTIAFFVSLIYSAYGIYNLAVFGTCDPSSPGTCEIKTGYTGLYDIFCAYEAYIVYTVVIIAIIAVNYFAYKYVTTKE